MSGQGMVEAITTGQPVERALDAMESIPIADDLAVAPPSRKASTPSSSGARATPSSAMASSKSATEFGSSKDMLLRLLQSEHFDAWIGLKYLCKYSGKDVGLQFYLCERLKTRPHDEIGFLLPQLCHLVVFSPADSTPLESFLLHVCQRSLHASIFTMWFLENYLNDFRTVIGTKEGALRYDRCGRTLHHVQLAVFGDFVKAAPLRRASKEASVEDLQRRDSSLVGVDTLPDVEATLVGFGCVLAAAGVPAAAKLMKPLVLMEARKKDRLGPMSKPTVRSLEEQLPVAGTASPPTQPIQHGQVKPRPMAGNFPSIEDLSQGRAFSFKNYLARTARQMKRINPPAFMAIHSSGGAAAGGRGTTPANAAADGVSDSVPLYYHAEMQFVMSLIDTSRRLCLVLPKEGRQQALQAELSLINHNLPASVCLPLWCHGVDVADPHCAGPCGRWKRTAPALGPKVPHHCILRIPPSEAVVLNSAERVPFVIYVEVVRGMPEADLHRLLSTHHAADHSASADEEGLEVRRHSDSQLATAHRASVPASPVVIRTPHLRSQSIQSTQALSPPDSEACPSPLRSPAIDDAPHTAPHSARLAPLEIIGSLSLLHQPIGSDDFAERMRTAAIMLAQLTRQATQPGCTAAKLADITAIKAKLIAEMEALEKSRLLDAIQARNGGENEYAAMDSLMVPVSALHAKDDPSASVFSESWEDKAARIRDASPYGYLAGWELMSVIVKSGADMRQEQLACQLIEEMHDIWNISGLPIWVYPFKILVASSDGGLVETVRDSISIHSIKKNAYQSRANLPGIAFTLRDYYIKTFGSPDSDGFINARDGFVRSLAGYSLVTYILQLRDRHNGNILVDAAGHLVHIDFGFMLSNAPGGYYGFESAPFKLTSEYIDLLGGLHGEPYHAFKELLLRGFLALRKHADRLLLLVEIMQKDSRLPCFQSGQASVNQLRQRFQLGLTDAQVKQYADRMVTSSTFNVFTRLYDSYQYYSNGIL